MSIREPWPELPTATLNWDTFGANAQKAFRKSLRKDEMSTLDTMTSQERKDRPLYSGVLNYFPDALAYVAMISKIGNDKHNPGQPLHWSREKSSDHKDCIARHLIDTGRFDPDGVRHSGYLAWRSLANLQIELEEAVNKQRDFEAMAEAFSSTIDMTKTQEIS